MSNSLLSESESESESENESESEVSLVCKRIQGLTSQSFVTLRYEVTCFLFLSALGLSKFRVEPELFWLRGRYASARIVYTALDTLRSCLFPRKAQTIKVWIPRD